MSDEYECNMFYESVQIGPWEAIIEEDVDSQGEPCYFTEINEEGTQTGWGRLHFPAGTTKTVMRCQLGRLIQERIIQINRQINNYAGLTCP